MPEVRIRTAPGHHFYRLAAGQWRYSTPQGRFVRVAGEESTLQEAADVLRSAHPVDADADFREPAGDPVQPGARALLEDLVRRGVAVEVPQAGAPDTPAAAHQAPTDDPTESSTGARPHVPPAASEVRIEGDGPVAQMVARLLTPRARVVRGEANEAAVAQAAVLISCADRLPDRRWSVVDRWCRESGTPWHRVYPEGLRWCLGPLYVPGGPGYRDVRGRILAASPWADELLGLWQHLDTAADPAPPTGIGTVAALAGALAADVDAFLDGRPVPGAGHQVVHDPHAGTWTRHPVLPLPVTAPLPTQARVVAGS